MAKNKPDETKLTADDNTKPKTCFVIMPIADHTDYESGHFNRVYEYLIKPACRKAGYEPIRADDSKASHMIMFDILKKIMDCDMAICDLSSKNANVFYELGLRQAFNKKTILITDGRESAPFDIAGFRYVRYSPSLRVDTVRIETEAIAEMLKETEAAPEDDVNSIVKLLKIQPAQVDRVELNQQESVFFEMFKVLDKKISTLTSDLKRMPNKDIFHSTSDFQNLVTFGDVLKRENPNPSDYIYRNWDKVIGKFYGTNENGDLVFRHEGRETQYPNVGLSWENIFVEDIV